MSSQALLNASTVVYYSFWQHGMSAYQIMCNNKTQEMRQTFPYLFQQVDALREHNKVEQQSKRSHASNTSRRSAASAFYEELNFPNELRYMPAYSQYRALYKGEVYPPVYDVYQPSNKKPPKARRGKGGSHSSRHRSPEGRNLSQSQDEEVKLSESSVLKNRMDFTKRNPLADDESVETPSQLKQRSEYSDIRVDRSTDEYRVTVHFY